MQEAETLLNETALPLHRLAQQLQEKRAAIAQLQASQGVDAAGRSLDEVAQLCRLSFARSSSMLHLSTLPCSSVQRQQTQLQPQACETHCRQRLTT